MQEKPGANGVWRCPRCKTGEVTRLKRRTFLDRTVYAFLGFYPWVCAECKHRSHLKVRDRRSQPRKAPGITDAFSTTPRP